MNPGRGLAAAPAWASPQPGQTPAPGSSQVRRRHGPGWLATPRRPTPFVGGRYNPGMSLRVIALFVVFVLLWSGLNTVEAPRILAPVAADQPAVLERLAETPAHTTSPEGSVEHHHLDDLPSQALSEPAAESPGLLPAPLAALPSAALASAPRGVLTAGAGSPDLAGPLRPPCDATRRA